MQPLLLQYTASPRAAGPGAPLRPPQGLLAQVHSNNKVLAEDTISDGNCGPHAFIISLQTRSRNDRALQNRAAIRKLFAAAARDTNTAIRLARDTAVDWMRTHADDLMWEGMTFKTLAMHMSHNRYSAYADWVEHMSINTTWIDASVLHAMGCAYGCDIAILQETVEPALLGPSIQPDFHGAEPVLIAVAMVNDLHYWGLRDQPKLPAPTAPVDNGQLVPFRADSSLGQPAEEEDVRATQSAFSRNSRDEQIARHENYEKKRFGLL